MAARLPVLIVLFCLVLFAGTINAQPGSYTNCFAFVLYDGKKVVTDTTGYQFVWKHFPERRKMGDDCLYAYKNKPHVISYRIMDRHNTDTLYIINPRLDTMHLTVVAPYGMDDEYLIEKLVFRKGYYTAADSQYKATGGGFLTTFAVRPTLRDSAGYLVVERFYIQDGKKIRRVTYRYEGKGIIGSRTKEYEEE